MTHMTGVTFSQNLPMPFTPPSKTAPQIITATTVVIQVGTPKIFSTAVDMV